MENIIEIEGLEKSYGDVKAVDGITSVSYTHLTYRTDLILWRL